MEIAPASSELVLTYLFGLPACSSQLCPRRQSSGVGVNSDCLEQFQQLKLGKKLKYIIYAIGAGGKEIVVEKTSSSDDYDEFVAQLPADDCRYAVYDLAFEKEGEGKRNKICFFAWSPDDAKVKSKMIYASSKDAIRKALVGIQTEIQGTDFSEITHEASEYPNLAGGPVALTCSRRVLSYSRKWSLACSCGVSSPREGFSLRLLKESATDRPGMLPPANDRNDGAPLFSFACTHTVSLKQTVTYTLRRRCSSVLVCCPIDKR